MCVLVLPALWLVRTSGSVEKTHEKVPSLTSDGNSLLSESPIAPSASECRVARVLLLALRGAFDHWVGALKTYDPGYEGRYAYNPRNTKQFA